MTQGFTSPIGATGFYGLTPLGPTLPNARFVSAFASTVGTGDVDLYTVPSGKRVLVLALNAISTTGSTGNATPIVKIGGSYYQLGQSVSITGSALGTVFPNIYVAEAGEIIAVNTTTTGFNIWIRAIEFDNTGPLFSPKLTSLSVGDNTLYTVPSGKSVFVIPLNYVAVNNPLCYIWNNSGGDRTYNTFAVPNGDVSALGNKTRNNRVVSAGTFDSIGVTIAPVLNSGDFFVINTDASTATQFVFTTVFEV